MRDSQRPTHREGSVRPGGRSSSFSRLALAACAFLACLSSATAQILVTDAAGRRVELPGPAKRVLLEAPGYYPALSLLSRNASELVVGVGATDARGLAEPERELAGKPRLGTITTQTFSVEKALALKPDLLIATLERPGQQATVEAAFARAGVPIIYVDFFVDPARNTIPSMEMIGRAIGAEKTAAEFAAFYRDRVSRIADRIAASKPASSSILVNRRSLDGTCCWSFAGSFISGFFDMLQIRNVADGRLRGIVGQLSLEAVIESRPEVFVATDMSLGRNSVFSQRSRAQSILELEALAARPGLRDLPAAQSRRMHMIDITLMRSPLNILALELFARWTHPTLFADLDPQATLDKINARFLTAPLEGPFWASLDPAGARQ